MGDDMGLYPHRAADLAVFDRIVDQIGENLFQFALVAHHLGHVRGQDDLDRRLFRLGAEIERLHHPAKQAVQADRIGRRRVFGQLHPRQGQKIADQPGHARHLFGHGLQEAFPGDGIVPRRAQQGFDIAAQRRQRRADLMAGIGDEIRPHPLYPLRLGEVAKHQGGDHAIARWLVQAGDAAGQFARHRHRQGDFDLDAGLVAAQHILHRFQHFRVAHHGGQRPAHRLVAENGPGRAVGQTDAERTIDQDQRIGQQVEHRPMAPVAFALQALQAGQRLFQHFDPLGRDRVFDQGFGQAGIVKGAVAPHQQGDQQGGGQQGDRTGDRPLQAESPRQGQQGQDHQARQGHFRRGDDKGGTQQPLHRQGTCRSGISAPYKRSGPTD